MIRPIIITLILVSIIGMAVKEIRTLPKSDRMKISNILGFWSLVLLFAIFVLAFITFLF